ncbi:hypothetical protein D9M70_586840 [compost metagenome]
MKFSEIETTAAIGRTLEGRTITVRDLLQAFAIVSGTKLGSQEFDRALGDPAQMHARETLANSSRFNALRSLIQAASESGPVTFEPIPGEPKLRSVSVTQNIEDGSRISAVTIEFSGPEQAQLGFEQALDNLTRA